MSLLRQTRASRQECTLDPMSLFSEALIDAVSVLLGILRLMQQTPTIDAQV